MIDAIDEQLAGWVEQTLPGVSVSFDPPAAGTAAGVGLHLFELGDLPPARGDARPPLQVRLGYLVTTSGEAVAEAHERLGNLLFAALQDPDYEVRFPGDLTGFWSAAGIPPRASFILSVVLRQPIDDQPAPPVTSRLRVQGAGARVLEGIVIGPGDVSIADAFVEIPSLALATRSDTRGRFRFAAVPEAPADLQLRVRAKAREFPFTVDSSTPQPVTLRLDLAKG